jgi:hypothetical protein
MAKAVLLESQSPDDESTHPSAMTPDADAAFCPV